MTKRQVIAFDLDGTLAATKSAVSNQMANSLRDLLLTYQVCVISGGVFEQFKTQLIDRLEVSPQQMSRLHIMPTSGTKYYQFEERSLMWVLQYSEDLAPQDRTRIIEILTTGAKALDLWETDPDGDIIEDRGSQITFSALGQQASAQKKYAWDPDRRKRESLRDYVALRLPHLAVHVGGTTSVDVTQAGIDKAYGIRKLMKVLELNYDDILFFGDKLDEGGNDHPVKAMGIDTIEVKDAEETTLAIEAITAVS